MDDIKAEEGLVIQQSLNELRWVQGKSRMYIRFPEAFKDYDSMKVYCKAEKVEIE